jgi:PEP-CTERM motif
MALGALLLSGSAALAQNVIFFDDFNGPQLNPVWAGVPAERNHVGLKRSGTSAYQGASGYSFNAIAGNSVLSMTNFLSPLQRRGFSTSTIFNPGSNFHLEARFNTLVQSPSTSIDGFMELWIFDASNPNRYDLISPFAGGYGSIRQVKPSSSIDANYGVQGFQFADNTWYRLVINAPQGQNIRLSLLSDSGTELFGTALAHGANAYASGFRITISESMNHPDVAYPTQVGLDYVQLTTVPEPSILALAGIGLAALVLRRR